MSEESPKEYVRSFDKLIYANWFYIALVAIVLFSIYSFIRKRVQAYKYNTAKEKEKRLQKERRAVLDQHVRKQRLGLQTQFSTDSGDEEYQRRLELEKEKKKQREELRREKIKDVLEAYVPFHNAYGVGHVLGTQSQEVKHRKKGSQKDDE